MKLLKVSAVESQGHKEPEPFQDGQRPVTRVESVENGEELSRGGSELEAHLSLVQEAMARSLISHWKFYTEFFPY